MGYLSDHNNSSKKSKFDKSLVEQIGVSVKKECIKLIIEGYNNYLHDNEKEFYFDEIKITAGLYGEIEKCICNTDTPCKLIPEYLELTELMMKGKETPKKAKKYDLIFFHFQNKPYTNLGVEAKLLCENNYQAKVATHLVSEYVGDKGMGKFINSLYKKDGVMLGYTLGQIDSIVENINLKVCKIYSKTEILNTTFEDEVLNPSIYSSTHTNSTLQLLHIFLDFNSQLN